MPEIIEVPARSRKDSRGMTEEQAQAYVDLMESLEEGQAILVDESESDGYEKSYSRGERVRNAIKKFKLTDETIKVQSFEKEDGKYVAAVSFKD